MGLRLTFYPIVPCGLRGCKNRPAPFPGRMSYKLGTLALITNMGLRLTFYPIVPCGLQGCKNRPAPFPGRMSYKATKPDLVCVLYLSMLYTVLLLIRATFYVLLVLVGMCSVFWLF